MTLDIPYHD